MTLALTLTLVLTLTRYGDGASDAAGVGGMIAYLRKHGMLTSTQGSNPRLAEDPRQPCPALLCSALLCSALLCYCAHACVPRLRQT